MTFKEDYRLCVRTSFDVMRRQRKCLIQDSLGHYSVIYNGLHESSSPAARSLYFQSYQIEWLDSHWNSLYELISGAETKDRQKEISLFFAEYFSKLYSESDSILSGPVTSVMLKTKKRSIDEMIQYSEKWEEKSNQLKVDLKKNKEYFKRLINEAASQESEEI